MPCHIHHLQNQSSLKIVLTLKNVRKISLQIPSTLVDRSKNVRKIYQLWNAFSLISWDLKLSPPNGPQTNITVPNDPILILIKFLKFLTHCKCVISWSHPGSIQTGCVTSWARETYLTGHLTWWCWMDCHTRTVTRQLLTVTQLAEPYWAIR